MSKPKLATRTPDDENLNALIPAHPQILALPTERRFAVVELSVAKIETRPATGEQQAHVQAVHIEVLPAADGERILLEAYKRRTGNATPPSTTSDTDTPLDGIADLGDDGV